MKETSAGGVVINNKKVCLLRKFRGDWVLPKGRIEPGETQEEAALREVKEESNLQAEIQKYVGYVKYWYMNNRQEKIQKTVHYYYMITEDEAPSPLKEEGFCEAKFFPLAEALEVVSHNSEKNMIKNTALLLEEKTR